jgi:hypothetical protein
MKYPLHLVERPDNTLEPYAIADADNIIVCKVMQSEWSWSFANWIVRSANRWHRWRKFFRPYTRDEWWEQPGLAGPKPQEGAFVVSQRIRASEPPVK